MSRERPILFSAPMVRALLARRKTVTRRVLKPQPPAVEAVKAMAGIDFSIFRHRDNTNGRFSVGGPVWAVRNLMRREPEWYCPFGVPGDRLWVRETFRTVQTNEVTSTYYRVDEEWHEGAGWRPSIFMPRSASRLTLDVVSVRVERLHDITDDDARAEGVVLQRLGGHGVLDGLYGADADTALWRSTASAAFMALWESINGAESLAANPWVWRVEFRRTGP